MSVEPANPPPTKEDQNTVQERDVQDSKFYKLFRNSGGHKIAVFADLEKLSRSIETAEGYDSLADIAPQDLEKFKDSQFQMSSSLLQSLMNKHPDTTSTFLAVRLRGIFPDPSYCNFALDYRIRAQKVLEHGHSYIIGALNALSC